jgi:hypothetical protein
LLQRQEEEPEDEEEEEPIQPKQAGGQTAHVGPGLHARINSMKGGGQPLPYSVRNFFEPRFGHDFSGVRVHTDIRAAEATRAVNARAFTVGQNIMFGARQYSIGSTAGEKLLAHELTHVVQQGQMPTLHIQRSLSDDDFATDLKQKIVYYLDHFGSHPEMAAVWINGWFDEYKMSRDDLISIIAELDSDTAGDLLDIRGIREYLKRKGVPWTFIISNWELSIHDRFVFLAGYFAGVGKTFIDMILFIKDLIVANIELMLPGGENKIAKKLGMVFQQLLNHPIDTLVQGFRQMEDDFHNHLENLRFFEAGVVLGELVAMLISSVEAIAGIAKLGASIIRAAQKLSLSAAKSLGIEEAIIRLVNNRQLRYVYTAAPTGQGSIAVINNAEGIIAVSQTGVIGTFSWSDALALSVASTNIAEMAALPEELQGPKSTAEAIEDLEKTTEGRQLRDPRERTVHAEAGKAFEAAEIKAWRTELGPKFKIITRKRFPKWLRRIFPGQSRPDMVAINRTERLIIVGDVTSNPGTTVARQFAKQETIMHLEKTMEYARRLAADLPKRYQGFRILAQERYWELGGKLSRLFIIKP